MPKPRAPGTDGTWNEMFGPTGEVRPHWNLIGQQINRWSADERSTMASSAARMVEDLGTTYNVFSDAGGVGQPYQLDGIPLVISPEEWAQVSAGLAQRTRLLDAVLADIYGPQTLLETGLVPPDFVHSSSTFLPCAAGIQPPGGRFLVSTGCDLVRAPDGIWTVLRDHVGSPNGLGQVFENRNVVSNLLSETFDTLGVARLGGFLNHERTTLESIAPSRGNQANIVFLTPGFRHPSYFEHAYKARLLGYPLVEPADLTVRERRLHLKTLAGLRRIDGVVCRVDHHGIDPLESTGGTSDGVPGLIEVWRTGNVALANAPGADFASSPGLLAFLPGISREWYGEELILPFVETWWLGQSEVRQGVMEHLHDFILLPASSGRDPLLPLQCSNLSPSARKRWIGIIEQRPHDFVVQRAIRPSETPSLENRNIRQRPFVWRAFTLNAPGGTEVLPGGLARIGKASQAPQLWPHHAGFTKDVWVAEAGVTQPRAEVPPYVSIEGHQSFAPEVPSRIAEQLFWVGRDAERIELATRLLRATLRCLSGEASRQQEAQLSACISLFAGTGLLPEDAVVHPLDTHRILARLIHDPAAASGIPALTLSLLNNAAAARDRLSDDTWRFFNRLESIVKPPLHPPDTSRLLGTLDTLVLHLSAFSGMQAENMTRGHGWRFLEIGRRLERALSGLRLLKAAAAHGQSETLVLETLLETCDSVMTYRRRHFSRPRLAAVIELVFRDPANPRSVAYQINVIHSEVARFSENPDYGLLPKIRHHIQDLRVLMECQPATGSSGFEEIIHSLETFADLLTQHFFSHSVRRVY